MAITLQCQLKIDPILPYPSSYSLPISHFASRRSRTCIMTDPGPLVTGFRDARPVLVLPLIENRFWTGVAPCI
jgi:hypothetical protein